MKGITSRGLLPLALLSISAATVSAQSSGRAFAVPDWYKISRVASPVLSPDGNTIAFTVTTVREAENKRHTEVWTQPVAGGPSKRMTSPAFESTAPRWSDDGKTLFFTSTRPYTRGTQWAIRMDEGGEAFQPEGTAAAPAGQGGRGGGGRGGAGDAAGVQPADKSFRITAAAPNATGNGTSGAGRGGDSARTELVPANANDPYSKMLPMAKPPGTAITKPLVAERFDGRHIIDPTYRSNDGGYQPSTGRAGGAGGAGGFGVVAGGGTSGAPAQLFITRTGGERKPLTATAYSHRSPSVSPDGKRVIFSADPMLRPDFVVRKEAEALAKLPPNRKRDEADRNEADLFVIDVATCEANAAACKPTKIEYSGAETNVIWSADNERIAFVGRPGRFAAARLQLAPAAGGRATDVHGSWKFEPGNIEWWSDGKIRMQTTTGGSSGLYAIDPATKQVSNVVGGRRQVSDISYDKNKTKVVYTSSDISHLAEIYVANADGSNEKKLTTFNDKLQSEVAFQPGEQFIYKSVDGMEIEGWLIKPFGYTAGKKYPLVLNIHGGPHSAYGEGWFDEFQSQAGAGLMVLYTNPRGSSGTNGAFTNSSRGDWGGKDYQDLMKAVDIAAARPDVDSTRMGVAGGSYGGFMTAWITTKTNRFKAAEADRMISDWTSWWGMSDAQGLTNNEFFGKPWENQIMYDTLSPIRFVKNVKTPTLIVQSEEDFRTPMGNADMWYMALRSQGVPAEFVRYPRSTHELSRSGEPWLLTDRLNRINQWFGHWLVEGGPKTTTTTSTVPDGR
ncbi:MAG: S9 family peptidase [Phycisphaerae bacterium]|nr:S9 family peptidase [Gemmatimonadaceae bacterium]